MLNAALAIIHDEHRSLSGIVHGLKYLVREARETGAAPDFKLLWSMLYYVDAFPEKLHHPRESAYLFARLRMRTHDADAVLDELEKQHVAGAQQVRDLEHALGYYEADKPNGLEVFAAAVDVFAEQIWQHMNIEEKFVIPLAKKHLLAEDWAELVRAFGENGDPRFGTEPDHEFRNLFSKIVNLAPPPIGLGPPR